MLRHFRNRSVFEFASIYADAQVCSVKQQHLLRARHIGMCRLCCQLHSRNKRDHPQAADNPPSYIVGIVADVIFIPSAPLYSYAYSKLNQHWQKQFSQQLNEKPKDPASALKEDLSQLKALAKTEGNRK